MNGDERSLALLRDTAACYRFVKAAAAACKLGGDFPSYLDPTRSLLLHMRRLSDATLTSLADFPSENPDGPEKLRRRREYLWVIRETWKNLHTYVQPAVDADTLKVPTELVHLLTQRVRLMDNCESMEFAVIHTDKLNYFQFPAGEFEEIAKGLGDVVSLSWEFPQHLGIIALPHSQAQHLFLNGLLAHEIGHFVFSRFNCLDRIKTALLEGLHSAVRPPFDTGLSPQVRGQLPETLQDWAEELFCDLFGVHLLGPSFVLASIELFDMANIWGAGGGIDERAGRSHFSFQWTHPARLFRLWRQTTLLEKLGWWKEISDIKSHHIHIMKESLGLRPSSFAFEKFAGPMGDRIIDAFCRVLQTVEDEVAEITRNFRNGEGQAKEIGEFSKQKTAIGTYLCHAIVPSTLYIDGEFKNPQAITLLNAAHLFYLSGIEELMSNTDKPNPADIEQRDIWMERVESWTMKGLEDIAILCIPGA